MYELINVFATQQFCSFWLLPFPCKWLQRAETCANCSLYSALSTFETNLYPRQRLLCVTSYANEQGCKEWCQLRFADITIVFKRFFFLKFYNFFFLQLLQRFRLEYHHEPLESYQKLFAVPDKPVKINLLIHRIHKWRTRGKKLVPSHESEALEDKQKLQMKTFSELAECSALIPLKITLYGRLFKYNYVGCLQL